MDMNESALQQLFEISTWPGKMQDEPVAAIKPFERVPSDFLLMN